MSVMESIFGRYLAPFLVLIGVQVVVVIVTTLQALSTASQFASSLVETITDSPVTGTVFNFLVDATEVISGVVIGLALVMFFISLRKRDHGRALKRLHDWASGAVVALAQYRQQAVDRDGATGRFDELRRIVARLTAPARAVKVDAELVDIRLGSSMTKIFHLLDAVEKKIRREDRTVLRDLPELQHELANIMIAVFGSSGEESGPDSRG
ncbi:MAG: hypothetical protein A2Z29_02910 [Chloroflexi bacterium RBG_16_56_11]|nr:MAG: hypothetical protein A2Z29_02910 [Chloroflexi bacterium RBG_16_56_11]